MTTSVAGRVNESIFWYELRYQIVENVYPNTFLVHFELSWANATHKKHINLLKQLSNSNCASKIAENLVTQTD